MNKLILFFAFIVIIQFSICREELNNVKNLRFLHRKSAYQANPNRNNSNNYNKFAGKIGRKFFSCTEMNSCLDINKCK